MELRGLEEGAEGEQDDPLDVGGRGGEGGGGLAMMFLFARIEWLVRGAGKKKWSDYYGMMARIYLVSSLFMFLVIFIVPSKHHTASALVYFFPLL